MDVMALLGETLRLWARALALRPAPDLGPHGWWPFLLVAGIATVSGAVGQSVVLYLNRLRGVALAFSLLSSLAVLMALAGLLGALIWVGARMVVGPTGPGVGELTRLVLVSTAPLAFSFLTVIPLLGPIIQRLLQGGAVAVLWSGATTLYEIAPWRLGVVLVLAALAAMGVQALLAPVVGGARDRVYRRLTGRDLHPDAAYLLELAEQG